MRPARFSATMISATLVICSDPFMNMVVYVACCATSCGPRFAVSAIEALSPCSPVVKPALLQNTVVAPNDAYVAADVRQRTQQPDYLPDPNRGGFVRTGM